MTKPKVTVIISTRNRPQLLLERALDSLIYQTFKDFEVLVIDDASDVPYKVPDLFLDIKYYRNEERKGLAHNRNKGAALAKGEYIVSLDDDNEFLPDFLNQTSAFLDRNKHYAAVAVGKDVVYPEGSIYQPPSDSPFASINDGFLIRKEAYLDVKCDERLQSQDDADLGIRFRKKYKIGALDKPLMTVYGSPIINTTSYSNYSDYHLKGLKQFWEEWHDEFANDPKEYSALTRYIGRMLYLAGRMIDAIRFFDSGRRLDNTFRNWLYLNTARLGFFKQFYIIEQKLLRYWRVYR